MQKGLFLTIEGMDGVGKGTQLEFIKSYLSFCNIGFICLREPGGTKIGEAIREILLDVENANMSDETELLLFNAARAQLVREKINPNLDAGIWVISDRFYDSTLAYQVGGRGLAEREALEIINFACGGLKPDLTLYLDLDEAEADERLGKRANETQENPDRLESAEMGFDSRVRKKYLEMAEHEDRIKTISAAGSVEEVSLRIKLALDEAIKSYRLLGN